MPDKEISQEFIFLKPEFIDHWSYQIDNGKRRILRESELYPYVKTFLKDVKECIKIVDIITRHQPFLIQLKDGTCKELHPSSETRDVHRVSITQDLATVMKGFEGEGTVLETRKQNVYNRFSRSDSIDSFLKGSIRGSEEKELSSKITQRRLK